MMQSANVEKKIFCQSKNSLGLRRLLVCGILLQALSYFGFSQASSGNFRTESSVVLVSTVARTKAGEMLYGLTARDFVIEDNGKEQIVTLDEAAAPDPISVVLVVQVGHSALFHLKKSSNSSASDPFYSEAERKDCRLRKLACSTSIGGIGTLLEALVDETNGEVAVVTFDSEVRLFQDFTQQPSHLNQRLRLLNPGDNGAAVLDAVGYSFRLFRHARNRRHVLILISENRDYGSRTETTSTLLQQLLASDTILYAIGFSSARAKFLHDLRDRSPQAEKTNMLNPLSMAVQGMHKNVAKSLAEFTGGEYLKFKDKRSFESGFQLVDNDIRNSYLLSFRPSDPTPGPHALQVHLREPRGDAIVSARTAYWAAQHH